MAQGRHHQCAFAAPRAPRRAPGAGLHRRCRGHRRPALHPARAQPGPFRRSPGRTGRPAADRRGRRRRVVVRGEACTRGVRRRHVPRRLGTGPGGRGQSRRAAGPRDLPGGPGRQRGRGRGPGPAPARLHRPGPPRRRPGPRLCARRGSGPRQPAGENNRLRRLWREQPPSPGGEQGRAGPAPGGLGAGRGRHSVLQRGHPVGDGLEWIPSPPASARMGKIALAG